MRALSLQDDPSTLRPSAAHATVLDRRGWIARGPAEAPTDNRAGVRSPVAPDLKRRLKTAGRRLLGAVVRWRGVVGLDYHRIGDGRDSPYDRGLYSATPEAFDRQLRWLKASFDVISPREISDALASRRGRHIVITFDDGFRDNHDLAFPILRAHGLSATFFVATGYIDAPRLPWWDELAWMVRTSPRTGIDVPGFLPATLRFDEPERQRAVEKLLWTYYRLPGTRTAAFLDAVGQATGTGRHAPLGAGHPWMTWDMIREMHAAGMTIGGHSVRHEILSRMAPAEQWAEISGCARRLEEELGAPMRAFSYPAGQPDSYDQSTRECLRRAGVVTAFTYFGGYNAPGAWDPYAIARSAPEQHQTFDEFRAMVVVPRSTVSSA